MTVNITGVTPGVEVDGSGSVVNVTVTTGGGGGGVTVHNLLTGRDATDSHPADAVSFTPGEPTDWTGDPEDVGAALDELAARESGGVALSDAAPQDLGTAAAGVSTEASRADHVHDMPTAADIAVDASGFNGNLTTSDDTVQEVAQKLDDLVIPAAGIADPGGSNDDFLQRKSGAWTNRTVAQVKTDLGMFGANRWPLAANDYIDLSERHGSGYAATTLSSNAFNSNGRVVYVPFLIGKTISVDLLAINCTGANDGASAVVRLGIYAESSGRPGSVVVDAGTASINGTGLKSLGFTAVQLTPGWYFAAVTAQGLNTSGSNPTFSSVSSAVKQMAPMPTPSSSNDVGGFMSSSSISGAFAANPTVSHGRAAVALPAFRVNMRVSTP